jgi:hypothetical protein
MCKPAAGRAARSATGGVPNAGFPRRQPSWGPVAAAALECPSSDVPAGTWDLTLMDEASFVNPGLYSKEA